MRVWLLVCAGASLFAFGGLNTATAHQGHHAPGKPFTRSASDALPAAYGEPAQATARCPRGSRAISGGWSVDPASTGVEVYESRRLGARRWRVSVEQAGTIAGPAELTAYAYCDRDAPPASVRKVTVAAESVSTLKASCPRGTRVTAGGFLSETALLGQSNLPLESRRSSRRSWLLTVHRAGFAEADSTVFAYCTPEVGRLRRRSGESPLIEGTVATARSGRCPRVSGARAGGFEVAYQTSASKYGISESRRAGRRWLTSANVLAGSAPDTELTSLAYCP